MHYPLIEHGGSGPTIHWAPANGFPLTTYRPIIEGLADRFRGISVPPRALWDGIGPPPERLGDWAELARDLVAGLREHGEGPVIAVGHSSGAVASLLATLTDRDLFRGLVLLDPTILPPATMDAWRIAKASGWTTMAHPLAPRARKRRSHFASFEEAFGYWRDRAMFADWSDDALRRYAEGNLRPDPARRTGLVLKWSGAWESYYYESIHVDTWRDVPRLDPTLPILVVRGGTSDTFATETASLFQERVPWASMATVPGFGHLFPQAAPDQTLKVLSEWLARTVR